MGCILFAQNNMNDSLLIILEENYDVNKQLFAKLDYGAFYKFTKILQDFSDILYDEDLNNYSFEVVEYYSRYEIRFYSPKKESWPYKTYKIPKTKREKKTQRLTLDFLEQFPGYQGEDWFFKRFYHLE